MEGLGTMVSGMPVLWEEGTGAWDDSRFSSGHPVDTGAVQIVDVGKECLVKKRMTFWRKNEPVLSSFLASL